MSGRTFSYSRAAWKKKLSPSPPSKTGTSMRVRSSAAAGASRAAMGSSPLSIRRGRSRIDGKGQGSSTTT